MVSKNERRRRAANERREQPAPVKFNIETLVRPGVNFEPSVSTLTIPGVGVKQLVTGGATRVEVCATQIACAMIASGEPVDDETARRAAAFAVDLIDASIDANNEHHDEAVEESRDERRKNLLAALDEAIADCEEQSEEQWQREHEGTLAEHVATLVWQRSVVQRSDEERLAAISTCEKKLRDIAGATDTEWSINHAGSRASALAGVKRELAILRDIETALGDD
jgi:hypothetical protein